MDFDAILAGPAAEAPSWLAPLVAALDDAPDPERARRLTADVLAAVPLSELEAAARARPEQLARILGALCGVAPFFKPFLTRYPQWLLELLADELARPRERETLESRLDEALDAAPDEAAERILREFKYRELARITARDCSDAWVPLDASAVTLEQLSLLADVILERALQVASKRLAASVGAPRWATRSGGDAALAFWVLGLGKLGSAELNYSSDVDLVYVYETGPDDIVVGEGQLAPPDYFTRLAQGFGKIVSPVTSEGFLYRIDLELRPDDTLGAPVISEDALFSYFEARADLWEKAAYMKARPVAGDLSRGWQSIRALAPMIYSTGIDYGGVGAIKSLKAKVEEAKGEGGRGFNVKIDPGGIRDIEYIAQALQLLHGARIPQIRERSTRNSLQHLADVGLLSREHGSQLYDAYLFLRRVENRLQMESERQTHVLPADAETRAHLARAVAFTSAEGLAEFDAAVARCREQVSALAGSSVTHDTAERILDLFVRNVPTLIVSPANQTLIQEVAEGFARHIEYSSDPTGALNNLDRFIAGIGTRRFYYELLIDRPEIVARLATLFGASKYLSGYFASHPTLIEPVFADPHTLLLSRDELQRDVEALLQVPEESPFDPTEHKLDALRRFHHRQIINVGLLDISEEVTRIAAEEALTTIAEVCLQAALDLATEMLENSNRPAPPGARDGSFLVVGMGKLSSGELSYGSDLDVIFLYDTAEEGGPVLLEAQEYFVRLTQRLISNLQTPTSAGSCYEIDARLRPSGNQGTLVTSLAGFRRYHAGESAVWERQALLRSRPVVGDHALAQRFAAERLEVLAKPVPDDLAAEVHRIRGRMEAEIAKETASRRDLKTGRGGLLDIETAVQYLQLCHGARHPELFAIARTEETIAKLARLGLLSAAQAETFTAGWEFLQRLGNRMRIVENRSISDLNVERGELGSLAKRLGYAPGGREGAEGRALLHDYERHTEAIRQVYLAVLDPPAQEPAR